VPSTRFNVDGEAVTPDGRPLAATATVPVKPLRGFALTETICPLPPAMSVAVGGVVVREKSAGGFEEL
jgi:hypothetical protein